MSTDKLCRKYLIRKADGTPIPEENKYFILRYDKKAEHGKINRALLGLWCHQMMEETPELAQDLYKDILGEENE